MWLERAENDDKEHRLASFSSHSWKTRMENWRPRLERMLFRAVDIVDTSLRSMPWCDTLAVFSGPFGATRVWSRSCRKCRDTESSHRTTQQSDGERGEKGKGFSVNRLVYIIIALNQSRQTGIIHQTVALDTSLTYTHTHAQAKTMLIISIVLYTNFIHEHHSQ